MVIVIIGILIAMLLPAVQAARESSRRAVCQNNQRQLGTALQSFYSARKFFPPGADIRSGATDPYIDFEWRTTGFVYLLPYLEEKTLHERYNYKLGPSGEDKDSQNGGGTKDQLFVKSARPPVYLCPSDATALEKTSQQGRDSHSDAANLNSPVTSYVFNSGRKWGSNRHDYFTRSLAKRKINRAGPFTPASRTDHNDVKDGLSKTFFVGEAAQNDLNTPAQVKYIAGWYDDPVDDRGINVTRHRVHAMWLEGDYHAMRSTEYGFYRSVKECVDQTGFTGSDDGTECRYFFGSSHPGVIVMTMGDASVHVIGEGISLNIWRALGTMAGGEGSHKL